MRLLPSQVLTPKQKRDTFGSEEEWAKACIDYYIAAGYNLMNSNLVGWYPFANGVTSHFYKKTMYDLYAGTYQFESFESLVKPFANKDLAIPTIPKNFNIIKPRIDELRGEEMSRPFSVNLYAINRDAVNHKQKIIQDLEVQRELNKILLDWKKYFGIELDQEYVKRIEEEYQKYAKGGAKLEIEKLANDIAEYLRQTTDWKRKTNEGFYHLLVTASEYYKVDSFGEEVNFRVVNPLNVFHNFPQNSILVDDCEFVVERRVMTVSDIIDEFSDFLTEEDVERLGKISNSDVMDSSGLLGLSDSWGYYGSRMLYVYNVEWKSKTKIKLVTRKDPPGIEYSFLVTPKDKYKRLPGDKVKSKWINEVWEGVRIGGRLDFFGMETGRNSESCVYTRVRKRPNQYRSVDNMARVKLSYVGVYSTNQNTISQSVVGYGAIYQEIYNIIWFRIERLLAQSKGKVLGIDLAQIPYSKGQKFEDVLYYLQSDGIFLFNSLETLEATGAPAAFNQFKEFDLTMSNSLTQLVNLLMSIRMEWEELSGVSKQRLGQMRATETATGVQSGLTQSAMITEPLYSIHYDTLKRLMLLLVEEAKYAWRNGKTTAYAIGDNNTAIINVLPRQLSFVDLGIASEDVSRNKIVMQTLQQLTQLAIQSGRLELASAIDILLSQSMAEIQAKLKAALERGQKLMQMQQQQQMKAEQQKQQLLLQLEQQKLEQAERFKQMDIQTEMKLAEIKKEIEIAKALHSYREGLLKAQLEMQKLKGEHPEMTEDIQKAFDKINTENKEIDDYYQFLGELMSNPEKAIAEYQQRHPELQLPPQQQQQQAPPQLQPQLQPQQPVNGQPILNS